MMSAIRNSSKRRVTRFRDYDGGIGDARTASQASRFVRHATRTETRGLCALVSA